MPPKRQHYVACQREALRYKNAIAPVIIMQNDFTRLHTASNIVEDCSNYKIIYNIIIYTFWLDTFQHNLGNETYYGYLT